MEIFIEKQCVSIDFGITIKFIGDWPGGKVSCNEPFSNAVSRIYRVHCSAIWIFLKNTIKYFVTKHLKKAFSHFLKKSTYVYAWIFSQIN